MNSKLKKYSMIFLWNPWKVLTRMHRRRKKDTFIGGMAVLIAAGTKLLDTNYMIYGFIDDLIETIN